MDRTEQRYERFATLRAEYPEETYDRIMDKISDEENDASEFTILAMIAAQDEARDE